MKNFTFSMQIPTKALQTKENTHNCIEYKQKRERENANILAATMCK